MKKIKIIGLQVAMLMCWNLFGAMDNGNDGDDGFHTPPRRPQYNPNEDIHRAPHKPSRTSDARKALNFADVGENKEEKEEKEEKTAEPSSNGLRHSITVNGVAFDTEVASIACPEMPFYSDSADRAELFNELLNRLPDRTHEQMGILSDIFQFIANNKQQGQEENAIIVALSKYFSMRDYEEELAGLYVNADYLCNHVIMKAISLHLLIVGQLNVFDGIFGSHHKSYSEDLAALFDQSFAFYSSLPVAGDCGWNLSLRCHYWYALNTYCESLFELYSEDEIYDFINGSDSLTKMIIRKFFYNHNQRAIDAFPINTVWPLIFNGNQAIDLSNQGLTSLAGVKELLVIRNDAKAIVGLNLQNNNLQEIPQDCFVDLTQLQILDLSNNHIETLPEGVFNNLEWLMGLLLAHNHLSYLPDGLFDRLNNLNVLNLNNNRLSGISSGLFRNLRRVRELELAFNRLGTLPSGLLYGMPRLQRLNLSNNCLLRLPEELFMQSAQLTQLYLANNRLLSLPENIFGGLLPADLDGALVFGNVALIDLSNNQIQALPSCIFSNTPGLVSLNLAGNILQELPLGLLNDMRGIRELSVADNNFNYQSLLNTINGLQNLETFWFAGNLLGQNQAPQILILLANRGIHDDFH